MDSKESNMESELATRIAAMSQDLGIDIRDVMAATTRSVSSVSTGDTAAMVELMSSESGTGGSLDGINDAFDSGAFAPPSFTVYQEPFTSTLTCHNPLVVTPNGEVVPTLDASLSVGTWYCNVYKSSGDSGGSGSQDSFTAKIEAEGKAVGDGSDEVCCASVKIAQITAEKITQYHTGAVIITGSSPSGAPTKGPFEPTFDSEGAISGVGSGFVPCGIRFYYKDTIPFDAVSSGIMYLRVDVPNVPEQEPDATIISGDTGAGAVQDYTNVMIPLYEIKDGKITVDYRASMSMPVRE